MESNSIAQDLAQMQQKTQAFTTAFAVLQQQISSQALSAQAAALSIEQQRLRAAELWAELQHNIHEIAEDIDYLYDLGKSNNLPELLFALKERG